jgi:L-rhamnose 1-dehydrogenase
MYARLKNKVAIVTGAGSKKGIGRAIAVGFAKEGAKVVAAGRTPENIKHTAQAIRQKGGEALNIVVDTSNSADVADLVEKTVSTFGRIDILVNNAGIAHFCPILKVTEEMFDRHFAINVKGYFLCAQAVAKQMISQGTGGKIINIGSVSAASAGEGKVHYCATKAAVRSLTQGLALELTQHKIYVNEIAPGTIDTNILRQDWLHNMVDSWDATEMVPDGRWGKGEDCVGAAIFLASDESTYMSGSVITVDGGLTAGSLLPKGWKTNVL